MTVMSFVMGPLLWTTLLIFALAIAGRTIVYFIAIVRSGEDKDSRWRYFLATLGRSLLPFYRAAPKTPLHAGVHYAFHFCLVAAPVWASGHIVLLSTSRFGWSWTMLPDLWTDAMTLLVVILAAWFFVRFLVVRDIDLNASNPRYVLIVVSAVPFLTGFIAHHQWFDYRTVLTIHMLAGEAMLVIAAFLFCRARLNAVKCNGCGACASKCPSGTLESRDKGRLRLFTYSTSQCIGCGTCIATCPEEAAELRHEISLKGLVQTLAKKEILSVELKECERCGCSFGPTLQLEQIEGVMADKNLEISLLKYCNKCRRRQMLNRAMSA